MLEHKHTLTIRHFLICADSNDRGLVVFYCEDSALRCISRHLYAPKQFLYLCFDAIFINVTYYHYALQVGTIPCFIIVAKHLIWKIVHHFHCAYWHTVAIATIGVKSRQQFFHYTLLRRHLAAPFFVNYAAFGIYFLLVEQ